MFRSWVMVAIVLVVGGGGLKFTLACQDVVEQFCVGTIKVPTALLGGPPESLVLAADGSTIAAIGFPGGTHLMVWETSTQRLVHSHRLESSLTNDLRGSPTGSVVARFSDRGVELIETATGQQHQLVKTNYPVEWCRDVAFSPQGDAVGVLIERQDGQGNYTESEIVFYDVASREKTWSALKPDIRVDRIAFAPDGPFALSGKAKDGSADSRRIEWWSVTMAIKQLTFSDVNDGFLCFSKSGDYLAVGKSVLSASNGTRLAALQRPHSVNDVAIESNGRWLATVGDDCHILFWDPSNGQKLAGFRAHDSAVKAVVASSDGKRLFTVSGDETIRIWDVEKILQAKPTDGYAERLASISMGKEAWILGEELVAVALPEAFDLWATPQEHLEKAQRAAKQLGVEIPPLPEGGDNGAIYNYLGETEEALLEKIESQHKTAPAALFLVAFRCKFMERTYRWSPQESRDSVATLVERVLGENLKLPAGCWAPYVRALRDDNESEPGTAHFRMSNEIRAYFER